MEVHAPGRTFKPALLSIISDWFPIRSLKPEYGAESDRYSKLVLILVLGKPKKSSICNP
jgi:hypothetical protein